MSMINEFVENLIERLDELRKIERDREDYRDKHDYYEDWKYAFEDGESNGRYHAYVKSIMIIKELAEEYKDIPDINVGKWIPVSEKLPENTDPVNITWVNHKPEPYYADIKDKPFTATGCYCDGKWYWYSVLCQAYLDEYRYSENDYIDNGIEVIAWMPLPESYKGE